MNSRFVGMRLPLLEETARLGDRSELERLFRGRYQEWIAGRPDRDVDTISLEGIVAPDTVLNAVHDHFVEHRDLVLLGGPGTGKTYAVRAIQREHVFYGTPCVFMSATQLGDREHTTDTLADVPVLIVDDIGAETDTSTRREKLFALFDARWQRGRPTVLTSYLVADSIAGRLADGVVARLSGPTLILGGRSRRKFPLPQPADASAELLSIAGDVHNDEAWLRWAKEVVRIGAFELVAPHADPVVPPGLAADEIAVIKRAVFGEGPAPPHSPDEQRAIYMRGLAECRKTLNNTCRPGATTTGRKT